MFLMSTHKDDYVFEQKWKIYSLVCPSYLKLLIAEIRNFTVLGSPGKRLETVEYTSRIKHEMIILHHYHVVGR